MPDVTRSSSRKVRDPLMLARLYMSARAALRYAERRGIPGTAFARFGRKLGWRTLIKGLRDGIDYVLTPVDIVRFFEFDFALSCLPAGGVRCLDVGSPRLFSLYVASRGASTRIRMINPDPNDISRTARIVSHLRLPNIETACLSIQALAKSGDSYDCIYSLSVVEHIAGDVDDGDAVELMYLLLCPRGRLVLTVPVDRAFRDEYRDEDPYGTQPRVGGRYFFQRWYDEAAINERLLSRIGTEPSATRWFGEISPGGYVSYEERWRREGHRCTVEGPREIADGYREFSSWKEMPGVGVCGLLIEKPE